MLWPLLSKKIFNSFISSKILLIITIAHIHETFGEKMLKNSFWLYRKKLDFSTRYNSFFILDFEATCDKHNQPNPQEIIEFPCLAVDTLNYTVLSKFHQYVKPKIHPELTSFCTHLTGISQDMVDTSNEFPIVLDEFKKWLNQHFDDTPEGSIFVTCGNWDLRTMLPNQCKQFDVEVPQQTRKWINLKTAFFQATGYYPRGLRDMADRLRIPLQGKLHSGIDDCLNIMRIMRVLKEKPFAFKETDVL